MRISIAKDGYIFIIPLLVLTVLTYSFSFNLAAGIVGLGFILIVALQLIIGGLNDYGVLSINETFKQYF